jgi:hypothetical protein
MARQERRAESRRYKNKSMHISGLRKGTVTCHASRPKWNFQSLPLPVRLVLRVRLKMYLRAFEITQIGVQTMSGRYQRVPWDYFTTYKVALKI